MDTTEFSAAKDWTAQGGNLKGKGAAHTEFRGLQADLDQYAQAWGFEGVAVDGILGPKTLAAVQAVTKAVVGKNPLLTPSTFAPPATVGARVQRGDRAVRRVHPRLARARRAEGADGRRDVIGATADQFSSPVPAGSSPVMPYFRSSLWRYLRSMSASRAAFEILPSARLSSHAT